MSQGFLARPELLGTFGMAASTHWLASATAMAVLERGGNAFDAAVAGGFVLQVAEPHLNGPGGEVPILFYAEDLGEARVLCGQGVAPQAATIERFRDLGLDLVPGTGLLASVVPGAWDGWLSLLRDFGTWPLADVLEPALHYAEKGCPLVPRAVATIAQVADLFRDHWQSSAALWLPGGEPPAAGGLYRNPALAATWRRLIAAGDGLGREAAITAARDAFYQGFVAEAIDQFCRTQEVVDVSGRAHRGLLTGQDLAAWRAHYEEPLCFDYGRYRVAKCGTWSQGPVFLQQLALLAGYDLRKLPTDGPDFIHLVVEASKLAFADRDGFYGDPAFATVPVDHLLSYDYAAERRKLIGAQAALEVLPGIIGGHRGWYDPKAAERASWVPEFGGTGFGEPTVRRDGATKGDTCHIDVVDRWGNMVAATPSGGWLQSSPTILELGFCLNTRAQMFWLDPACPAALGPGRRPRTTLTPSFAFRDGQPYLAFGTPGGDQQDQWSLAFFLRHADHGLGLQAAIEAPAFTSEHWANSFWPRAARPGRLLVEDRLPTATIDELRRRGHGVEAVNGWSLGRMSAVARDGDLLRAAANPRGQQGYAVGR